MRTTLPRVYEAVQRRKYRWFYERKIHADLPRGMVSFTFDDFPASAASVAAPILEREGWRGTYYLSPGLVGMTSDIGRICTKIEIESLLDRRHEIGNHTFSHMRCSGVSRRELHAESFLSTKYLSRFSNVNHFAFPFGAHDETAQMFFSKRFATLRGIQKGMNHIIFDLNNLRANAIYQTSNLDEISALVRQTLKCRAWTIFYTHDVGADPSSFGCTTELFKTVVSIVRNAGAEVVTIDEGYRRLLSVCKPITFSK